MTITAKRVVLFDGHNLTNRALYAQSMTGGKLDPEKIDPERIATSVEATVENWSQRLNVTGGRALTVFDGGNQRRRAIFPEYKANRSGLDPKIREGINAAIEIMRGRFASTLIEGEEADDVIATYVAYLTNGGKYRVAIVSSDKDLLQLVAPDVTVYHLKITAGEWDTFDEAEFESRYGFAPYRLPVFKAFVGDISDGIPGVHLIGKKTATELIQIYGNLDAIYAAVGAASGAIKPRVRGLLEAGREIAYRNVNLCTLYDAIEGVPHKG